MILRFRRLFVLSFAFIAGVLPIWADALKGVNAGDLDRAKSGLSGRIGGEVNTFVGVAKEIGMEIAKDKVREEILEKASKVVEKAKDKLDEKLNITDTYNEINRKVDNGMEWVSEKASKIQGKIYEIDTKIQRARNMVAAARQVADVIAGAFVMPTTNEVLLKIGEFGNGCLDKFDMGASSVQGGMAEVGGNLKELEDYLNQIRNGVTNTMETTVGDLERGISGEVAKKIDEALEAAEKAANGETSEGEDGLTAEERAEKERDEKEQEEADAARKRGEEWRNPETGDTMTRIEREEYEEKMEQQEEADKIRAEGGTWINPETGGTMTMKEMDDQQAEAEKVRDSGGVWHDPETGDTKTALERYMDAASERELNAGSYDNGNDDGLSKSASELAEKIRQERSKKDL